VEDFHLVLVDASGYIFRAFHALPPMNRADGTPVNAVLGFSQMLSRLLQTHAGTHIAVVFDASRTTFRNEIYAGYKAHRPEAPPELAPQFALVREATAAFGTAGVEVEGWEADDVIASYAEAAVAAGGRVTIVSSDKDLMQLVSERVVMQDPIKQKLIGPAEVAEKFGVEPARVVDVQALMGDSVDNVPGVPGIGQKTAAGLIGEFGSLDGVLAAAPGMKAGKRRELLIEHADAARMSRQLVTLARDVALPLPLDALVVREPERAGLTNWLTAQGFRSLIARLGLDAPMAPAAEVVSGEAPFGPYPPVTTEAGLAAWIARARVAGVVAVKAMTTGLDAMRAGLVGVSLAVGRGEACYVPLAHEGLAEQVALEAGREMLAGLLADASVLKVFQNAKYDLLVLAQAGLGVVAPLDDTMIVSYSMEAGAHGHDLEELARLHLGHAPATLGSVTGTGRARLPFAQVPLERATAYAAEVADVTWRLWQALRPRLREARSLALYEQVERRLVPVLAGMEREGVRVDENELRRMSADFEVRMAEMERDIHRFAGREFNLGSAKQLGEVLFDELKLPGAKRLPGGTWATDAILLQQLAEVGHALPARILEWRQLAKLKSTYADALVEQIDPATGRVHTSFSQAVASTGRLSSTDPNLQNIPIRTEEGARIRRAFVAEEGHVLVSCDYSQIELRLMAHVADVPALRASFAAGEDIHSRTANEVFGAPMEGMDPAIRRNAKTINFGIIYGISAFGLASRLGIDAGEARRYIAAYFDRYPEIRAYMERVKEEARRYGYVLTPFGRRCWIPQIGDKRPTIRAYAERAAINAPLQGGAADIIKRAMVRLPAVLRQSGLRARMLLQVHDELLFEAPEGEAEALARLARGVMERAATISVPLLVETGAGRSWAEAH